METALLVGLAAMFTSALTAAMGVGGGVVLLALMAQVVPPNVLIPLHGAAQLMSNTARVVVQRKHIQWAFITPFALGALLGGALLTPLVLFIPVQVGQIGLGLFILLAVWRSRWLKLTYWAPCISGTITTGLSLVIGATGPLVMSVLPRDRWERQVVVGTHGMAMTIQHGVKLIAFASLNFSLEAYWPMLLGIGLATVVGNVAGARLLGLIPEARFKFALDWLLTLLAARLVWQGGTGF
ncbi:MAG: sulfite exporter TauE/SafE family protein [Limnobacter sp.]|nr:sulfite exporter TauE/SafE family protein [Limnobacter sp.]